MSISKISAFLVLACLLISSAVAQSPAPAPSSGGGRRIISPAISPSPSKTPTPESPVTSPTTSSPQADSPSMDSPAQAPGPAESNAVSNRFTVFGGSVAVMLCVAVLAL